MFGILARHTVHILTVLCHGFDQVLLEIHINYLQIQVSVRLAGHTVHILTVLCHALDQGLHHIVLHIYLQK